MGRTACTEPQCLYKGALYFTLCHVDTMLAILMKLKVVKLFKKFVAFKVNYHSLSCKKGLPLSLERQIQSRNIFFKTN